MAISADIDNTALMATLKKFPKNIQRNVMTGAVRAGAAVIRNEARVRVPKRTGNLKKSIIVMKRKTESYGLIRFSVTPSKKGKNSGWYAHFIEFGTIHQSAKPFMRPALDAKQDEALQASQEYIAKRIPEEVLKAQR